MKRFVWFVCLLVAQQAFSQPFSYPKTRKTNVVDNYHGTKIADPFRWLEEDTSTEVSNWVDEQNKLTYSYLEKITYLPKIKQRLTELFNYPKIGMPRKAGKYYLFEKNEGLQNQSVTYIQEGLTGNPSVFLDPNTLSEDGTVTASLLSFSKDKKYVAVSYSRSGSDWQEFGVIELPSGKKLSDKLEWVKVSGAVWHGNGFYYRRYDKPEPGKEYSNLNANQKVYYHTLGDPQEKDKLVFEDPAFPLRYYGMEITEDERFLIISAAEGTDGSQILYKDLQGNQSEFKILLPGFSYNHDVVDNIGGKLLVKTNLGAPNYRVVLIDPTSPEPAKWQTIIAEKPHLLQSVSVAGGKLFVQYLENVSTHVYQHNRAGQLEREISMPALGTAGGFYGEKEDTEVFYYFTSFTYPTTIYRYNIAEGKTTLFIKPDVKFNPDEYETKQVFYPGKDGTKVPMFIIHKKGLKLNGKNPTLLYAYGGFNISITPSFTVGNLILLEKGGVYALANIRGGSEFGEKWHQGGMLLNKQNVFDDFIAGAEYLIKSGYTSTEKLAIEGRSNGGLLVGACITQRPDLYKVAFPGVGVLDMLRYHKFTIGWGWAVEYGSSDSLKHFNNLIKYSPLHRVKKGTAYPATLVTTADHDDRVVPAHSFKFAAALQEAQAGNNPTLILISRKSGHGAGKPTTKVIEELAIKWAFMFWNTQTKYE